MSLSSPPQRGSLHFAVGFSGHSPRVGSCPVPFNFCSPCSYPACQLVESRCLMSQGMPRIIAMVTSAKLHCCVIYLPADLSSINM